MCGGKTVFSFRDRGNATPEIGTPVVRSLVNVLVMTLLALASVASDKVCITCGVKENEHAGQNSISFWDQKNVTMRIRTPFVGYLVNELVMTLLDQWRRTRYVSLVESMKINLRQQNIKMLTATTYMLE